jgi:hypothetical protein
MFETAIVIRLGVLDFEEADTTTLGNTGNYTPNNTLKYPRKQL